jgi:hypothetical protein
LATADVDDIAGPEGEFRLAEARTIVARLLVALALIVQIVAPAQASVAMVAAATDPLATAWICGQHDGSLDGSSTADACRLCDLVCHGAGFAEAPAAPTVAVPATRVVDVVRPLAAADLHIGRLAAAFLARGPPSNA